MRRINPQTNEPFKYGDVREDGFVFVDFRLTRPLKKSGYYQENWLSPEKFQSRAEYSRIKRGEWRSSRPIYTKEYAKWHAKEKADMYAAKAAKRRAAKLQRTPFWDPDTHLIPQLYQVAAMYTRESGQPWHVDHILPLQGKKVSGLHVYANLRVIPGEENIKKSNKYDV